MPIEQGADAGRVDAGGAAGPGGGTGRSGPGSGDDVVAPDSGGSGRRSRFGGAPVRPLALSFLWPGLGLIDAGARRSGALVVAATATPAALGLWWLARRSPAEMAGLAVRPGVLRTVVVLSLVLLVARIALAFGVAAVRTAADVPAGTDGEPTHAGAAEGWPWSTRMAVAVLAAALAVPHVAVAGYAADQLALLGTVFTSEDADVALPTPLDGTDPDSAPPGGATTTDADGPDADRPGDPTTGTAADTATGADAVTTWNGRERVTVALLGSDGGFDRVGVRTDSIIVVSLDVATGDAAAFSVPRNWERMPFPGGTPADRAYPRGFDGLAFGIYKLGVEQPELFPRTADPGGTAIKQSLAQLLGIPVDHYVMVDMRGVVETIDLFGGIDLTLSEDIADGAGPIEAGGPPLVIDAEAGRHHFDGMTTLAYARARMQSSDYSRMTRQRCVIEALVDQVSPLEAVRKYDGLRSIMRRHVKTDIPVDELPGLLDIAERLDTERMTTVNFVPPTFPTGAAPVELVRETVAEVLAGDHDGTEGDGDDRPLVDDPNVPTQDWRAEVEASRRAEAYEQADEWRNEVDWVRSQRAREEAGPARDGDLGITSSGRWSPTTRSSGSGLATTAASSVPAPTEDLAGACGRS